MDDLLHALRIKGRATQSELAGLLGADTPTVEARLRTLEGDGLVVERATGRRPGWMLSPTGRGRHEEQLQKSVTADEQERLGAEYVGFLRANQRVKSACTTWQTVDDHGERFAILEELHDVHESVSPVLTRSGEIVPRFRRYAERLADALQQAQADPRFVVSPLVESYHTVWFECHEDYLVTLGRSRSDEGSF
jgi:DNA-binding MarR family transcriptional regulator